MTTTPVIPKHYGRLRRWWCTKFPPVDVCPVTRWTHRWIGSWWVTCTACGQTGYAEYGR